MSPGGLGVPRGVRCPQVCASPLGDITPCATAAWGQSPSIVRGLWFLVPPPSPHAGRSCARHMSPLSPTVCGPVPAAWCRGAHGCPASGAGRPPWGAVLGLPGGITSPKSSCGERKSGMSRAEPARDVWEELSGLGSFDEMGAGGAFPAGGLQRWALQWHLGQGWGQVTLLLVTPEPQRIPGTPGNPRCFCPQGTDKHRCQGRLDHEVRAFPELPRLVPLGDSGVWSRDSARASGHEEWVRLSPP